MMERTYLTDEEATRYLMWFRGDTDALDMVETIFSITHLWDDLIDKDKPITDGMINGAFFDALVTLQRNPFYNRYAGEFITLLEQGIRDWITSNFLLTNKNYAGAFILRGSVLRVFSHCAFIIGGQDWGQKVANQMNALAFDDFEAFMEEHGEN